MREDRTALFRFSEREDGEGDVRFSVADEDRVGSVTDRFCAEDIAGRSVPMTGRMRLVRCPGRRKEAVVSSFGRC